MSAVRLALKVDVDTYVGLRDGMPLLLETFRRLRVPASIFVSCGPDHTGRAIVRVLRPGFLSKMRRTGVATYGWRTVLYGTLLPGPQIARSCPDVLRAARDDGHEIGVHGYDHVYWQDRLPRLRPAQITDQLERAAAVLSEILGTRPTSCAAPGWQCTAASFACEESAGFRYRSDTRGVAPFVPEMEGRVFSAPEIPTTLPTVDEVYGRCGTTPGELTAYYRGLLKPGLNVHTIHTEIEGMRFHEHFEDLIEAVRGEVQFVRLCDVAASLPNDLPTARVVMREIPGRSGVVACQDASGRRTEDGGLRCED